MIVTRFAPSPTGRLHLGHAFSAALGHVKGAGKRRAASCCGSRISTRDAAGPSSSTAFTRTCSWLGLDWDEPVLVQSERTQAYADALDTLRERGLVYACFCTRADIAQSLTAPHGDAATSYPGTCRPLPDDPERRATTPHCWRLDSAKALQARRRFRRGRKPMAEASRPTKRRSATPSSPGRMRPRAIICPASSTMRRAA